jgi:alpha-beta hydrolase superfamily lysophospholipase
MEKVAHRPRPVKKSLCTALLATVLSSLLPLLNGLDLPASAAVEFQNQSSLGRQLKIPVHAWSDASVTSKGVIVAVPALIFNGRAYDGIARHLSGKGYTVYSADIRGYGDWLTNSSDFGDDRAIHYGMSKDDLTHLLQAVRKAYPGQKIFCLGESLGANIALWEASTEPTLIDGVISVGMTNRNRRLMPRAHWAVTITKGLEHPKRPIDLKPYMKPVLTEKRSVSEAMVNDAETTTAISPTDLIKANITNKNSIKEVEKIPQSMPILMIAGARDRVQDTRSLHELMQRIGSNQKQLTILEGKGHLLLEHREVDPAVAEIIDTWLAKQVSKPLNSTAAPVEIGSGQMTETAR